MAPTLTLLQTCVSTLSMRHLAIGGGPITRLDDLRTPMSVILDNLAVQLAELERYKARYGPLPAPEEDEDEDVDFESRSQSEISVASV